jgi:hypothetical protein
LINLLTNFIIYITILSFKLREDEEEEGEEEEGEEEEGEEEEAEGGGRGEEGEKLKKITGLLGGYIRYLNQSSNTRTVYVVNLTFIYIRHYTLLKMFVKYMIQKMFMGFEQNFVNF